MNLLIYRRVHVGRIQVYLHCIGGVGEELHLDPGKLSGRPEVRGLARTVDRQIQRIAQGRVLCLPNGLIKKRGLQVHLGPFADKGELAAYGLRVQRHHAGAVLGIVDRVVGFIGVPHGVVDMPQEDPAVRSAEFPCKAGVPFGKAAVFKQIVFALGAGIDAQHAAARVVLVILRSQRVFAGRVGVGLRRFHPAKDHAAPDIKRVRNALAGLRINAVAAQIHQTEITDAVFAPLRPGIVIGIVKVRQAQIMPQLVRQHADGIGRTVIHLLGNGDVAAQRNAVRRRQLGCELVRQLDIPERIGVGPQIVFFAVFKRPGGGGLVPRHNKRERHLVCGDLPVAVRIVGSKINVSVRRLDSGDQRLV